MQTEAQTRVFSSLDTCPTKLRYFPGGEQHSQGIYVLVEPAQVRKNEGEHFGDYKTNDAGARFKALLSLLLCAFFSPDMLPATFEKEDYGTTFTMNTQFAPAIGRDYGNVVARDMQVRERRAVCHTRTHECCEGALTLTLSFICLCDLILVC